MLEDIVEVATEAWFEELRMRGIVKRRVLLKFAILIKAACRHVQFSEMNQNSNSKNTRSMNYNWKKLNSIIYQIVLLVPDFFVSIPTNCWEQEPCRTGSTCKKFHFLIFFWVPFLKLIFHWIKISCYAQFWIRVASNHISSFSTSIYIIRKASLSKLLPNTHQTIYQFATNTSS